MATRVLHENPEDDDVPPLTGNRSGGASSSRSNRRGEKDLDEIMRPRWKLPGLPNTNSQGPKGRPTTPSSINVDHVKSSGYGQGYPASRPLTHADLAADLEVAQDQLSFQHAIAEASAEQIRFLEASQATTTAEFHEKEAGGGPGDLRLVQPYLCAPPSGIAQS